MGWFQADCPIGTDDRIWADGATDWVRRELGVDANARPVLLPSDPTLPLVQVDSVPGLRSLADRLCAHMGVDPGLVTVGEFGQTSENEVTQLLPDGVIELLSEGHFRTAAGGVFIALEACAGRTPTQLVASIAHELSHLRLPARSEVDGTAEGDDEELVDLVSVYLGLGVFAANACFDSAKVAGYRTVSFRTSVVGFMTEPMYGYVLARYALQRHESDPTWAEALDTNPRTYLKQALRFLAADEAGQRE